MLLATVVASGPSHAALQVFACEPEWAALAGELGGEMVETYSASSALQDVHKIQPRPSLIAKYRQADLVVCTGAELEAGWFSALAQKANNPKVRQGTSGYFEASRFVTMLDVPAQVDRSMGDVHAYGNPHIQTNPNNIVPIAEALAARLAQLDPENASAYGSRHAAFAQHWQSSIRRWTERAVPLKGVALVSHHRNWVYLYDWLGIDEVATLEPKPGIPPSAGHLEGVLQAVERRPVKMVVYSSYEDPKAAVWLSERAGIPAVRLPSSVGGVDAAADLNSYYETILARLLAALEGKSSK